MWIMKWKLQLRICVSGKTHHADACKKESAANAMTFKLMMCKTATQPEKWLQPGEVQIGKLILEMCNCVRPKLQTKPYRHMTAVSNWSID